MPLSKDSKVQRQIFTITPAQNKWLVKEAKRLTSTKSAIIRSLIRKQSGVA